MSQHEILAGPRVRLVSLERAHLPRRVEFINNPEVQATLNFDFPTSLARTEAWFNNIVLATNRREFAIEEMVGGKPIGFCGFIGIDRDARKAEHYIFIGDTEFWGQGHGKESYKLLVNFGFIELGLNRIWGYQLEHNERALQLVKGIGWQIEGMLKDDILSHGELKSRRIIAILREDWANNKQYLQL